MSIATFLAQEGRLGPVERSETESRRFGLEIGRLDVPMAASVEVDELSGLLGVSGVDVVVVRYPAIRVDWFSQLQTPEWSAVHADTLLYLSKEIGALAQPEHEVELIPVISGEHQEILRQVALESFEGYPSHYFANPLLARASIAEGYAEWAASFVEGAVDGHRRGAFLARLRGTSEVVGLAALSYQPEPEFVLVAVAPSYGGRRLYGAILRAMEPRLAQLGAGQCYISTQVHNTPVLRTVTAEGFRPFLALQTVHLVRRRLLPS